MNNMYNYMDDKVKNELIKILIDDKFTIEDVLSYIDVEMGNMYKLGYEDGELHA